MSTSSLSVLLAMVVISSYALLFHDLVNPLASPPPPSRTSLPRPQNELPQVCPSLFAEHVHADANSITTESGDGLFAPPPALVCGEPSESATPRSFATSPNDSRHIGGLVLFFLGYVAGLAHMYLWRSDFLCAKARTCTLSASILPSSPKSLMALPPSTSVRPSALSTPQKLKCKADARRMLKVRNAISNDIEERKAKKLEGIVQRCLEIKEEVKMEQENMDDQQLHLLISTHLNENGSSKTIDPYHLKALHQKRSVDKMKREGLPMTELEANQISI